MYRPEMNFNVAMVILRPQTIKVQGSIRKKYPKPEEINFDDCLFFGNFKTYGGTETTSNGVITIQDTVIVNTWYRPDITSDCRIYVCNTGRQYDIISPPENIDMRNMYLQFKMQAVGGKT